MAMVLIMAIVLWVAVAVVLATGLGAALARRGSLTAQGLDSQDQDQHARAA